MLYDRRWEQKTTKKLRGWRRVLWEAADLIETKGWVQDDMITKHGYCLLGAITTVRASEELRAIAYGHLAEATGNPSMAVWNDMPGRTKKQVLAALRTTATA